MLIVTGLAGVPFPLSTFTIAARGSLPDSAAQVSNTAKNIKATIRRIPSSLISLFLVRLLTNRVNTLVIDSLSLKVKSYFG